MHAFSTIQKSSYQLMNSLTSSLTLLWQMIVPLDVFVLTHSFNRSVNERLEYYPSRVTCYLILKRLYIQCALKQSDVNTEEISQQNENRLVENRV